MSPMKLRIQTRSGKTTEVEIDTEDTVKDLKKKVLSLRKVAIARQRFTLPVQNPKDKAVVLEDDKQLSSYNLTNGSTIMFKDLGPQIGYSTVFFWEYFGPLVVYPLFYFLPHIFYPGTKQPGGKHLVQTLAVAYWCFHYSKRILETFFVHRFGHATMPLFNLFKNCTYYWGFAAFVSFFVNHPLFSPPPENVSIACMAAALVCQLANYRCHVILANLRKPGDKGYSIPRGFLFNYITCANYTAEIWGWILFTLATSCLPAAMFTAAGALQMVVWAQQKHARLRKIFDGKDGREKYPRRCVILPPFL